jgi:hypothetical protein
VKAPAKSSQDRPRVAYNTDIERHLSMNTREREGALTALSDFVGPHTAKHHTGANSVPPQWVTKMNPAQALVPNLASPILTDRAALVTIRSNPVSGPYASMTRQDFVSMIAPRNTDAGNRIRSSVPPAASRPIEAAIATAKVAVGSRLVRKTAPVAATANLATVEQKAPVTPKLPGTSKANLRTAMVSGPLTPPEMSSQGMRIPASTASNPDRVAVALPEHGLRNGSERLSHPPVVTTDIQKVVVPPVLVAKSRPVELSSSPNDRSGTFVSTPGKTVVSESLVQSHSQQNSVFAPRTSLPRLAAIDIKPAHRSGVMGSITVALAPPSTMPSSLPGAYTAGPHDTVNSVANRFGLPVSIVAAANKVSPTAHFTRGAKVRLPQQLTVSYAGKPVAGDVAPVLVGSTSMTPFRFLFEQQGGKVAWDQKNQRVTATNGSHEVTLTVGSPKAVVNQKDVMMDLAAFLLSGRTMVPVRFFEKALHAQVEWEPTTGRIFVAMAN